jgi:hypothetical protein
LRREISLSARTSWRFLRRRLLKDSQAVGPENSLSRAAQASNHVAPFAIGANEQGMVRGGLCPETGFLIGGGRVKGCLRRIDIFL